jgi:thiamine-monophosphate kinase
MSSEFEFLDRIRKKFSLGKTGDDCAVLPKDSKTDMVITADMLVEDIDFRLDWGRTELLGHKALAVSLSDIAAMGATPTWAMLSLAVPERLWDSKLLDSFYESWHELARVHGVELVGGDISKTDGKLVIDSIAAGEVPRGKAILRSTASTGDPIFVTGPLGGAAGGLKSLEDEMFQCFFPPFGTLRLTLKQLQPTPRVEAGKLLQSQGLATSMIDISDGLSSDLAHICRASGTGAVLHSEKIPIYEFLDEITHDPGELLDLALNGGEDFELLFTCDRKKISAAKKAGFCHIGEITANEGIVELIVDGETRVLTPAGYSHF